MEFDSILLLLKENILTIGFIVIILSVIIYVLTWKLKMYGLLLSIAIYTGSFLFIVNRYEITVFSYMAQLPHRQ